MIKKTAKKISQQIRKSQIPDSLVKNQVKIDDSDLKKLELSIKENYFKGWRNEKNYKGETYAIELHSHLIGRLNSDRIKYIPWFNKTVKLNGANVLEIGCGTGSSTVAFAEQGANITGVDIDEGALKVAEDRCKIYNRKANLINGNASGIVDHLKNQKFDLIVFFASMEHMTYSERIESLTKYHDLLPEGGCLSIIETPNRLWYWDGHTSLLPFFHWLPDHLAYDYSKFSNRINFKELYHDYSDEKFLHFLRRGRGFSYHEFEIALNRPAESLNVVDYLKVPFVPFSLNNKFRKFLIKASPKISKGFFNPFIDLILKKE